MNNFFLSQAIFATEFLNCILLSFQMGSNFIHTVYMDYEKKYNLSWNFDEKEIVFETVVNTTGYVGFGLSPDGTMEDSDIVIGEVNDDHSSLEDYRGYGNGTIIKDTVASWFLLSAIETNNQTKFTFKRKLITNDLNGMNITNDTTRVIWAFADGIFSKENFKVGGFKSLLLLQAARPKISVPTDAEKVMILMNETLIPNKTTTYLCKHFQLPKYKQRMQIIKISPIVTKGNELIVHHILFYSCENKSVKRKEEVHICYNENMPDIWEKCSMVVFGWAIGGSDVPLPEHVGIPIEVSNDPVIFLLEIHYNNPGRKSGVLDSSGFELLLMPARRKFDGAILESGQIQILPLFQFNQMIPPYQPQFRSNGVCISSCLYDEYPSKNDNVVIRIFAVLLHAHLLAKQVVLHHFRNGKELTNIASDRNYDFNYQEMVFLNKEVEILRGDDLKVECVYNSMSRRNFTWGGLSTSDEMCLAYIMYYPKIRTTNCLSSIGVNDLNWLEYHLNEFNLFQYKNPEFARNFEQTVNGVGRRSSFLTYCSDGTNTTLRYQPASNLFRILQYEMPRTTDISFSTTHITSKAAFDVVSQSRLNLQAIFFVGLVFHLFAH